jgi:hypothetical protein
VPLTALQHSMDLVPVLPTMLVTLSAPICAILVMRLALLVLLQPPEPVVIRLANPLVLIKGPKDAIVA